MKIINRAFFALLILFIPLTCVLAAVNVTFRLPDIYRYEFDRSGVIKEIGLSGLSSDELADFFSKYMTGRIDEFQFSSYYMGRERPLFGIGESAAMESFRALLNESAVYAAVMLTAVLLIYAFLLKQGRKEAVRYAYRAGIVLYALLQAGAAAVAFKPGLREMLTDNFFSYRCGETDMLSQLLPPAFLIENGVVALLISLLILGCGYSGTKRVTRPDRMFY
jgi:hypothetical protein